MLERAPHTLTIVNRTAAKADALVDQFAQAARDAACHLSGGSARAIEAGAYDVIVNATAGSWMLRCPNATTARSAAARLLTT